MEKTLSIIMPVYNEKDTILKILEKIEKTELSVKKELVIIDDFSTDGTREILKKISKYKIIFNEENQGKGSSIRRGLQHATGDFIIIQDADLEYDPQDYNKILQFAIENDFDVVYGSRFLNTKHDELLINYYGNRILTFLTNWLYNAQLTDMETCYKLFKIGVIKSLDLKSKRFDFEPEVTAKVLKKGLKINEVPINYKFRTFNEGKKITYIDGLKAIYYLLKYRFF